MRLHRRTFIKCFLLILFVTATIASCLRPPDCSNPQDRFCTRVLFIGNSYTYANDLPNKFAKLAKSGKHEVEVGVIAEGGWTLADHVKSTDTFDTLSSKKWTFVVLQEQSQIPSVEQARSTSMYPAARTLVKQIRGTGAQPLFFVTWAHRDGFPENGMSDYASMQSQVEAGYSKISRELNVPDVEVGAAWQAIVSDHPEIDLWEDDGSHPSREGTYLTACVFYATIFRESPVGLTYTASLPKDVAKTLQTVAAETVLKTH